MLAEDEVDVNGHQLSLEVGVEGGWGVECCQAKGFKYFLL